MQAPAAALIDAQPPLLVELASVASLAVRIEPELLRALRLALVRRADAGTEAQLWFGPLIEARGLDGIVLRADLTESLRARLAADARRLATAWRITQRIHRTISPAIQLEERVAWLALTGGPAAASAIERELESALSALVREGRSGIARWAIRALPRMPKVARTTTAAWLLAFRAAHDVGQRPRLDTEPPPGLMNADLSKLLPNVGQVELGVARRGGKIVMGDDVHGADVKAIRVPDTEPRYLEVRIDSRAGPLSNVVALPAKTVIEVEAEPRVGVSLVTADRRLYRVDPLPPPAVEILAAHADRKDADLLRAVLRAEVPSGEFQPVVSDEIDKKTRTAIRNVVLVLVSPAATISQWWLAEVAEARKTVRPAALIPMLLRPTAPNNNPLRDLQHLPRDNKGLGSLDPERLRAVAREVVDLAYQLQQGDLHELVVSADGLAPFRTIAQAMAVAQPWDTVFVQPGVYKENVALKPNVSLVGEHATRVIVDGGDQGWVLRAAEGCEIANLTIRNSGAETGVNDAGILVEGCRGVRVHHNVITKNGHYGMIVRNAEVTIHDNIITNNAILGIYVDEGAELDVFQNLFQGHKHSAVDIPSGRPRGRFRRNTVLDCGTGLTYESSLRSPLELEVFDNIFTHQKYGVSAPAKWASKVDHNLFHKVKRPYDDWEHATGVRLDKSNREGDPLFRPGSFALRPGSPAIRAGRDGGDLGAYPYDETPTSEPPVARPKKRPKKRPRPKKRSAQKRVTKKKAPTKKAPTKKAAKKK